MGLESGGIAEAESIEDGAIDLIEAKVGDQVVIELCGSVELLRLQRFGAERLHERSGPSLTT